MKKSNLVLILGITFISLFSVSSCKDAKDAAITKILEMQVKEINDKCPMQLDAITRLDSCKSIPQRTLKIFITVMNIDASTFDAKSFEKITKPTLIYGIQTTGDLKLARENDITFVYSYNDEKGSLLGEITVTSEDYNKPIDETNKGGLASMSETDMNSLLENSATGIKKQLPLEIEQGVFLVDCEATPGKVLKYTYVVNSLSIAQFDSVAFKNATKPTLSRIAQNSKEVKDMLDAGVTYLYVYKDKDEKYLCQIGISSKN